MTVTTSYLFILFVIDTLLNLSLLKRGFVNAFEITSNSSLSAPNGTSIRTTHSTGDYNTTTTFEPEYCTDIQSDRLFQATKDIITLVSSVFSNGELKERNENISLARQQINFNNRAAIDYFGPPSQNKDFQGNILETLTRLAAAYPGWGFEDWLADRYVKLSCKDEEGRCLPGQTAYSDDNIHPKYTTIVLCPLYFKLPTHAQAWAKVKTSELFQTNVLNMGSQATELCHELLHVGKGAAVVCPQGCVDQAMKLGVGQGSKEQVVRVYRPGNAKLLAQSRFLPVDGPQGPERASRNNDNFVYYIASRFIEKNLGSYPLRPQMWQYTLTVQENELKFDSIGKASTLDENLFAEVWDPLDPPLPLGTPNGTFPASDYPEFYQSILSQDGADSATTTSIITPTTTSISTPTITSISTTITTSSGPSPTPSQAIVIYLREVCPPQPRAICRSFAWEYNITPGQSVDVCAQTPDYTQMYSIAFSNAISNGDTDYSISVGPFDISETVTGCYYNATEPVPGELTCVGLKQPCFGNLVKPTTCGVATNTQIAYAEW